MGVIVNAVALFHSVPEGKMIIFNLVWVTGLAAREIFKIIALKTGNADVLKGK